MRRRLSACPPSPSLLTRSLLFFDRSSGISEKYSLHHNVRILDGSLVLAAQLAKQYLTQRRLPDSAIGTSPVSNTLPLFHSLAC